MIGLESGAAFGDQPRAPADPWPAVDRIEDVTWPLWAPPPRVTLSEWADAYRVLDAGSSAEPGRWRTSRTPYLREPMDVIADRHVETVVIMASSQVGKTEVLLNLIGYTIDVDPGPMMLIEPTLDLAGAVSKDRIAPMLRVTPKIAGLVAAARSRDSSNTTLHKAFRGCALTLAGANSPTSLASRPIRILLCDEVDRWPETAGAEGDPLALAIKRASTFLRRKIVVVSSPTIKGASRIEDWYQISDQRRYHTPCPRCGVLFVLEWKDVRWENHDPATACLECPTCHGRIEDSERPGMIAAGEWVAAAPFTGIAGFHLWEMFSPWRSLKEQVTAFYVARRSLELRQAWVNTALGQVWEAPGERIEPSALMTRREAFTGDLLPAGVQILTCGVDTQDDRLETIVLGWGTGEECWVLDRASLYGDPTKPDVWQELDDLLDRDWPHTAGGTMRIQSTLVDSAGHRTQAVYQAVIARQHKKVWASIGRSGGDRGQIVSPPHPIRPKNGTGTVLLRTVDVDQVKALLFARLKVSDVGPEYVHFPQTVGETFFEELTAEKLVTKRNKFGVPSKRWEQIRERNEALDTSVLAHAALRIVAPTPAKFDTLAAQIEKLRLASAASAPAPSEPTLQAPAPPRKPAWIRPRHGWLKGNR